MYIFFSSFNKRKYKNLLKKNIACNIEIETIMISETFVKKNRD